MTTRGIGVAFERRPALRGVDLVVAEGETIGLVGRNGAGKTTLLRVLAGVQTPARGQVERGASAAYVPQDLRAFLTAETVRAELRATLRRLRTDPHEIPAAVDATLAAFGLEALADRDPRLLSGGERQRVAVAAVAVGAPAVLMLDEPTRGMDVAARDALGAAISAHTRQGGAVVLATHDMELAARVATRVVVLADGEVVADGRPESVLAGSLFAPAMLRIAPPFLTVDEFARACDREGT